MSADRPPRRTRQAPREGTWVLRRAGLATRLLVGQAVVLVAGALTVGLVAAVVGPPIFHEHLLRAGLPEGASEMVHVELAYRDASLVDAQTQRIGFFPPQVLNAMDWAEGFENWIEARSLARPLLPFLLLTARRAGDG